MYGHSARKALFAILKDAPEMKLGRFPNARGKEGQITDSLLRQLTNRVILDFWHRGFAVSARTPDDKGDRNPEHHADWRATKRIGAHG